MPCEYAFVKQPTELDIINTKRAEDLSRIEQELAAGIATIETDPITGQARVVGASVQPQGMSDLCVLDALQQRGSVEFQLAAAHAGVQQQNFTSQHAHAHQHGHKH